MKINVSNPKADLTAKIAYVIRRAMVMIIVAATLVALSKFRVKSLNYRFKAQTASQKFPH